MNLQMHRRSRFKNKTREIRADEAVEGFNAKFKYSTINN